MKLSPIADSIAQALRNAWNRHCDWDALRLEVDVLTGSEHPTSRLDILTDMVKRRLPEH